MISTKEDALRFLKKANEEGLCEDEINEIVKFLTETKLTGQECINLLHCLIPKTKIPDDSLEELLFWFFTEVGSEKISNGLARKFLQWLTGVIYYELADPSVVESHYYSFIFLLRKTYLESCVCQLLCLISKPEDAKRWVVQQILHVPNGGYPKPHSYAVLSLLKSYRADVLPERIPLRSFQYNATGFDEALKKAHDRKLKDNRQIVSSDNSNIQWLTLSLHDGKSKRLTRLVPSAVSLQGNFGQKHKGRKLQTVYNFKTMTSLGVRPFLVECPAETLSLLANIAGYHILAFSDDVIQTRFFHKLFHTLCRVYLFELEPYSEKEKIFFLSALKELQEYTQQSIPVVTTFLCYYLPVWDGEDCVEQILGLLEWLEIRGEDDLEKYVFPSLRQIFISSGTHCKCLIIGTMGKLLRNLLIMDKKEQNCFRSDFQSCNVIKCVEAIHNFVGGLISNGLIWNNERGTRSVLNAALEFYETTQAVEQAEDLPLIMIMPPALVYNCMFSGSRVCIARICSLLVRLQLISVERLYLLGVFEDFSAEVKKLNIYILDYYRCLWSKLNLREDQDSFIFQHDIFCDKFWKLKETYGNVMDKIFGIEYNSSFWDPQAKGLREVVMCQLAEDYPAIVRLKQIAEERILQEF